MRLRTRSGFASTMKTPTFPAASITLPICASLNAAARNGCAGEDSRIGILPKAQASLFAVRSLQVEYLAPAMMDDLLVVETSAAAVRGASITFHQRVMRGDKALVTASVLVASIRNDRPARIPADLRRRLQPSA